MSKQELILEGLNCANCATKIQQEVNGIENVHKAHLNFVTKTLVVELKDGNAIDTVIKNIRSIVKHHEPDVIVKEKVIHQKKNLIILGIICASCATKMEDRIKKLKGVKDAYINFSTGKMTIEVLNDKDFKLIAPKAIEIIKAIEPKVDVTIENAPLTTQSNEKKHKFELIQLLIGILLFGINLVLDLDPPLQIVLYGMSYLLIGFEVLYKAFRNISRGQVFDENFLMGIATLGAFIIGEYPEAIAVMLFYEIGEFFQDLAINRSRKSITSLMDLRPDYANLKVGDAIERTSPENVNVGQTIVVQPGERIPLDGKVISGTSMLDTSALTGESVPRKIKPEEDVLSGMVNKNGVLTIEVTKPFAESTITKILDLVENASAKKAPTEQFITKFAKYYTPFVVFSALALALIPPIITGDAFSDWIYRALVFLVISCPCALVVSIPLGFFGGIGGASKQGILVKGGNYLEALNKVDTAVFDKTGTLTKGIFEVTEIKPFNGGSKDQLLEYAAYAEFFSTHPIATSIKEKYAKRIQQNLITDYDEIAGHGIIATIDNKPIAIGNIKLMAKEKISVKQPNCVGTIVHVAIDQTYAGYLVISDELKDDAKITINQLKKLGVKKTVLLTGDIKNVADAMGTALELDQVYSELLPDEKVSKLEILEKEKGNGALVFVGDGINDAPVLARADVGIAMGGLGSDAAIEAADIVLMTDEPSKLVTAIKIARRTRRIVLQNIVFALGIKAFVLLLGAFGIATMWEAVFADVGVTIIAVLNAMRALKTK